MDYKLPDFLIVGAAKSGTSSLVNYLREHPEIFIPREKELHFFLYADNPPSYLSNHILGPTLIWNFQDYINIFKNYYNFICGEASVTYLYSKTYNKVIKNIKRYYSSCDELKILIILRNPIDRAFSQYVTRLLDGEEKTFLEAVDLWETREKNGWSIAFDYLGFSYYYEPVKAYLENFNYVKIYLFEDFKSNNIEVVKDIFRFLNVDSEFVPPNLDIKYNVSGLPRSKLHAICYDLIVNNPLNLIIRNILPCNLKERIKQKLINKTFVKPQMNPEEREYLKKIFMEDILKLQDLIKRDLSGWLK